jgi:hypothetical protein
MAAFTPTVLAIAQGGNFTSAPGVRSSTASAQSAGAVVIASVAGTTVTVNIQGSADGVNYFNIGYALVATPTTYVQSALTITTTTTTTYLLQNYGYQFVQIVASANTGMTLSATAYL